MALSRQRVGGFDRMRGVSARFLAKWATYAMMAGSTLLTGHSQGVTLAGASADTDHDGLSDALEQALLERFLPRFRLSAGECDARPAAFAEGVERATPLLRDGTIYGQVTPRGLDGRGLPLIEVHFYDLWSKDCGRKGHVLDAEHVSVLLTAHDATAPAARWRATYWFAAAHEATMCDMSQVATAAALDATEHGPEIWISQGKHAAYLAESICNGGCGADRCERSEVLPVPRVVNLGEATAAMNGAIWTEDARWPMQVKMATDFPAEALTRLERQDLGEPVLRNGAHGSVRGTIYVANATYGGLATSAGNTAGALGTADDETQGALATSGNNTVHALAKSVGSVRGALGKAVHAAVRRERKTDEGGGK